MTTYDLSFFIVGAGTALSLFFLYSGALECWRKNGAGFATLLVLMSVVVIGLAVKSCRDIVQDRAAHACQKT